MAVRYPDGFEQQDDEGNELFMILEKCLYGMPSAAREWSKCRDSFIMRKFSSDGWSVKKCRHDPCLFVIDKVIDPKNHSTRVLRVYSYDLINDKETGTLSALLY